MKAFNFNQWSQSNLAAIELALDDNVPAYAPAGLGEAMRYAVLDGGKRLRPLLVLASMEASAAGQQAGWMQDAAMRAACAVELIHAYSLVHDDMPCMDNDVLRRGKATVHVKFGQAQALLAGDALQSLAFELITPDDSDIPDAVQTKLCALLARAAYMETCVEDDEIAERMDQGRLALMQRGDNQVGPYQSPMEDGMQHFHEWYKRRMASSS